MPGAGRSGGQPAAERIRFQANGVVSVFPPASSNVRVSVPGTMQSRFDQTRSEPEVITISRCASPASTRQGSEPVLVIATVNVGLMPGANEVTAGVITRARAAGAQSATPPVSVGVSPGRGRPAPTTWRPGVAGVSPESRPARNHTTSAMTISGMPSTTKRRTQ